MKTIVAIHDLSCHAKSSLTVVIPTLAALGLEASFLPTALLSTQTDGFEGYSYLDLTTEMEKILKHWESLNFSFDGLYSGFLGSEKQIDIVLRLIDDVKQSNSSSLIVVDPVLGDEGRAYGPVSGLLIDRMAQVVKHADVITPNITEAALLLSKPYNSHLSVEEAHKWAKELSLLGPQYVVITSVMQHEVGYSVGYDRTHDVHFSHHAHYAPISYPGCGDLFASIVSALMIQNHSFDSAVKKATHLVAQAVFTSLKAEVPQRMGVAVELVIKELVDLIT